MKYGAETFDRLGQEGLHRPGLRQPQGRGHGHRVHRRQVPDDRLRQLVVRPVHGRDQGLRLGHVPLPGQHARRRLRGQPVGRPGRTPKNKDLAYDFIDITMRPEIQAIIGNNGGVPVAADPPTITDPKTKRAHRELQRGRSTGRRPGLLPRLARRPATTTCWSSAFQALINGPRRPAAVLDAARHALRGRPRGHQPSGERPASGRPGPPDPARRHPARRRDEQRDPAWRRQHRRTSRRAARARRVLLALPRAGRRRCFTVRHPASRSC